MMIIHGLRSRFTLILYFKQPSIHPANTAFFLGFIQHPLDKQASFFAIPHILAKVVISEGKNQEWNAFAYTLKKVVVF